MPFILNQEIENKQARLAVWEINEPIGILHSMVKLNFNEQNLFCEIRNENRAKQWLVSRIILDHISGNKELSIIYEESGRPLIKDEHFHISISHTSRFVAVILSKNLKVGIDIEGVHDRILKIRSKFVSSEENIFLKEDNSLVENLILIWSAKEALFKMDGKGNMDFRKNISIKPFNLQETGLITGAISKDKLVHDFSLSYQKIKDHIMVFVTTPI